MCSKSCKRFSCSVSTFVPCCLHKVDLHPWTTGGVEVPTTAAKTRLLKNTFDAILTIFYQQCSDMQLDVGQNIVQFSCVECGVKLLEFAHTSACVCVSCFCAIDAHDFFAKCFIGCRRSMRRRQVTATRELQHDTSLTKFFVLGALVLALLLATWWVRSPIDDVPGGQSDHRGQIALAPIRFKDALMLRTHLLSIFKHVVGFECHDISFECCLQLCLFQQRVSMRNFIECFECVPN